MARQHQLAIFDLIEISKVQSHVVSSSNVPMHKIIADSEIKDAL